jgi:hypothetical protein
VLPFSIKFTTYIICHKSKYCLVCEWLQKGVWIGKRIYWSLTTSNCN